MDAADLVDMYFLSLRSALLETAAGLDRIQAAPGGAAALDEPRLRKLREACALIGGEEPDRARRFQMMLSEPLEPEE
jgi:hypothetical protein